ncbi:unnamed protein product [Gemmataceae bacterium]|nr:unnamed protein product [Gemmataceae bacterium]VTU01410.1 unnamed protein product [Gemmataceae bacterium]
MRCCGTVRTGRRTSEGTCCPTVPWLPGRREPRHRRASERGRCPGRDSRRADPTPALREGRRAARRSRRCPSLRCPSRRPARSRCPRQGTTPLRSGRTSPGRPTTQDRETGPPKASPHPNRRASFSSWVWGSAALRRSGSNRTGGVVESRDERRCLTRHRGRLGRACSARHRDAERRPTRRSGRDPASDRITVLLIAGVLGRGGAILRRNHEREGHGAGATGPQRRL